MHVRPTIALSLLAALLTGCSPSTKARDPHAVSVLRLSDAPTLEIGVLEGDEQYTFENVTSAVRLADGNLVVADAGPSTISIFTPGGTFVRRFGGRGEGPGEFRALSRVYGRGTDSVMALDMWTRRMSVFDTSGTFAHQVALEDFSADSTFALDVWLYRRFWVDGVIGKSERARVNAVLDRLPPPRSGPGYRVVRVALDGRLWIREPGVTDAGDRTWTVTSADGTPEAVVTVPAHFEPFTIRTNEVLGRWTGESDVNFVRAYDVMPGGGETRAPSWLVDAPAEPVPPPEEQAFMDAIRGTIRQMASAQEIHYASAGTYTARLDSLVWEQPEDIVVDVVEAGPRGWVAVFTHPGLDRICGLGYGSIVPPGWDPGRIVCAPPVSTGASED